MIDGNIMSDILNSLKDRLVFVDTNHIIRHVNRAAIAHYEDGQKLIGHSVLDCHNAQSQQLILEIFHAMKNGEEERMITDNETHRIFMRAVRNERGELIGYYERYEPSQSVNNSSKPGQALEKSILNE